MRIQRSVTTSERSRSRLKRSAVAALARVLGVPASVIAERLLRLSARQTGVVFAYHGVEYRPSDPDTQILAAHEASVFEAQLRHLRSRYRIVPAGEMLAAVRLRKRGERFPVAITFDDDLGSHASVALPILQRAGAPATFFLSGASLGKPYAFWWERLQRAVETDVADVHALVFPRRNLPHAGIRELCDAIEEATPLERDAVATRLSQAIGPDPSEAGMREADVRALRQAGMTIGFHTLRHDRLPPLRDSELELAMAAGGKELEHVSEHPLTVIGYPHGQADERVAAAARKAGFCTGFLLNDEAVAPNDDPLLLGRVNPTRGSVGMFAAHLVYHLLRRP